MNWLNSGWELLDTVEGGYRVLSVRQRVPLDDEFEHLVYEIAEGLLATLDQLAFAIAERNSSAWTAEQRARSAFPIRDNEPANSKARKSYNDNVQFWPALALAELDALQPYRHPAGPERAPLWLLRDLANRGKHRIIAVIQSGMALQNFSMGSGRIESLEMMGPIDAITEDPQAYMRMSLANNMNASASLNVQINFGPGSLLAGYSVMDSLNEIHDYVRNVALRKLLPFA